MIDYKQLETTDPDDYPLDVELITDDHQGEMAQIRTMVKECGFEEIDVPDSPGDDGQYHINIPGSLVGEFSDYTYDFDNGLLEQNMERWNQEAIRKIEEDS